MAFPDMKRAFDSVCRELLFSILVLIFFPKYSFKVVKPLYTDTTARARFERELTDASLDSSKQSLSVAILFGKHF